ncbi:hypothetical protein CR161_02515 [Prosthecochloris sp. ZM]|uniref:DUF4276 family protein n=1 Tax=Prosthecochloris sp. ZM TaxID=2283143 RepID=UPI000DF83629|nr:DUF4276 family protein [Prosthecochloris sp. ZM]RDD29667.1 hypothetical protein CR161_02515 [Prosthecochloris sp. ZM]
MIYLLVTTEGPTEQRFVKDVLARHLAHYDVYADARCVLTSKDNRSSAEYRGGLSSYQKVLDDITSWMKERAGSDCRFSTMIDLYGLPHDFPGFPPDSSDPYQRVDTLERSFAEGVGDSRFIPYIQLHEFETLVLADPSKLDWEYIEHERQIRNLIKKVEGKNPEHINEGYETAPSRRIQKEIPEYDKVGAGIEVVQQIGLPLLREKCRHFHEWVTRLENLAQK